MVGFLTVLLAAFCFCFQNVIVRVLFTQHRVLGLLPGAGWVMGGYVTPTLPHAFLLLVMRMAVVVPVLAVLSPWIYPDMGKDLRRLGRPEWRSHLGLAIAAGSLMFLYLALLYIAIGLIPTGVALTLFFTYPVFTALFSWQLFGTAPTRLSWSVMGFVFFGSVLTMPALDTHTSASTHLGIGLGIASGLAYAGYIVLAQQSFKAVHPIPFTWLSFLVTLILSMTFLGLWRGELGDLPWCELWVGGILSALATASGHLLNNLGIRRIGATAAAIVGATNPAFTVVLAWLTIQETLSIIQIVGVSIVTLSVVLLSRDYRRLKTT